MVDLSSMKNILAPLAESVVIPLELTAVILATDEAIQRKFMGKD